MLAAADLFLLRRRLRVVSRATVLIGTSGGCWLFLSSRKNQSENMNSEPQIGSISVYSAEN